MPLLEVEDLATHIYTEAGIVRAVDGVSLTIGEGETLGLVGESGCGKTMTARSIVRLEPGRARIVAGHIRFGGVEVLDLSDEELRQLRGRNVGFIFQDPMTSLNPLMTIGRQVAEPMCLHLGLSAKAAAVRAADLLGRVGIPRPRERLDDYPHQLSGGMAQRVMIAIAMSREPRLLIADEPTTALDVTIQAQILELIRSLSEETGLAVLLITHNLGIAAGMCDRICVMYGGRIVETAAVDDLFYAPRMPYSWSLLEALPRPDAEPGDALSTIEGAPPNLVDEVRGCRFAPRCQHARSTCLEHEPELTPRLGDQHRARCHATEADGWLR